MDSELMSAFLTRLDMAGINVDQRSVNVSAEENLRFNAKLFTLQLDGQEHKQSGRFVSLSVDSRSHIISLVVFERLRELSGCVRLIARLD